jgi:hypothetical protein
MTKRDTTLKTTPLYGTGVFVSDEDVVVVVLRTGGI